MIENALHRLLPESAQTTLETMFFATPDRVSADPCRPDGELIAASLSFQGSPPGRFGLLVSVPTARTLAADFAGCDESCLVAEQVTGVIGELANMICGAAVSRLESDAHFDLSSPEVTEVGANEPGPDFNAGSPSTCRFEFSGGTLVFFLAFGEPS
jgi:CheY-specific phosphatase CheX